MSYIFDHFVGPFAALMIISGVLAFFSNGIVFSLLLKKHEKLLSCEFLVGLKCILSAMYGILLMIPGLSYFTSEASVINRVKNNLTVFCFVHYAWHNFIIHACLGLVLLIAANRYAAVKLAVDYRTIFSRKRTCIAIVILLITAFLNATPDFFSCRFSSFFEDFASAIQKYYIFVKAILLLTCFIMMFYVYRVISVFFSEPFWSPVLRILSKLFKCRLCCRSSSREDSEVCANPASTVNNLPMTTKTANGTPRQACRQGSNSNRVEEGVDDNFDEVGQLNAGCVNLNQIQIANGSQNYSMAATEDRQCSFGGASSHMSDHTPKPNGGRFQQVLKSTAAQTQAIYMRRRRRRLRSRHQITATMFFACVVFLIVTLPTSLYEVIVIFLPEKWVSDKLSMDFYLVTSMFYGLLFILNPFLFTCNDKRMRKELGKIVKCFPIRNFCSMLVAKFSCCKERSAVTLASSAA